MTNAIKKHINIDWCSETAVGNKVTLTNFQKIAEDRRALPTPGSSYVDIYVKVHVHICVQTNKQMMYLFTKVMKRKAWCMTKIVSIIVLLSVYYTQYYGTQVKRIYNYATLINACVCVRTPSRHLLGKCTPNFVITTLMIIVGHPLHCWGGRDS